MKTYPIIGGPLDGQAAKGFKDFEGYRRKWNPSSNTFEPVPGTEGRLVAWADEYVPYNRNQAHTTARVNAAPTMVFLHTSLLTR